jgi:putative tricarboxylic transport membrane protein
MRDGTAPPLLQNHRIGGVALAAAGVLAFWMALDYPRGSASEPGPAYFPMIVAVLLFVSGALVATFDGPSRALALSALWERGRPLAMLSALAVAASIVERAGFRLTLAGLLLFFLAIVERRNIVVAVAIAVALPLGSFALLHDALKINLPVGPFGF